MYKKNKTEIFYGIFLGTAIIFSIFLAAETIYSTDITVNTVNTVNTITYKQKDFNDSKSK